MMARTSSLYQCVSSFWLFILTLDSRFDGGRGIGTVDIDRHLEMGRELLAKGQYADALTHFHAAVEADSSNYLTYFKRATCYLALAKSKSALPDLDKVIELKPDFIAARMQRGGVLLKQGRLDEAHLDFESVLRRDPHNPEALRLYTSIDPIKRDIQMAQILLSERDFGSAINVLTKLIEACPWDPNLRELRAEGFIHLGELNQAISDIKPTTKLRNDNTEAYYKLSTLHYQLGESEESLTEIRECLKLDPDHKKCFTFYKKVKKLAAQLKAIQSLINENKYEDCVEKASQMLKLESEVHPFIVKGKSFICHCNLKANLITEAIEACTEVLALEENAPSLCDRAEAYIANDMFDEAVHDYQRAVNLDENLQRAQAGLERSQKLLKQSKKKDYYKILGVKRTASKRDILKAYRKLAQKWHPDNFQGDEKKKAEKKFIDIAGAKEVLTDPEKRQKFDNGEDPLDPESQNGQGFNPFNPFGSHFQFKFHFN